MTKQEAAYLKQAVEVAMQKPGNMQPHGPAQQALYAAVFAILNYFISNGD